MSFIFSFTLHFNNLHIPCPQLNAMIRMASWLEAISMFFLSLCIVCVYGVWLQSLGTVAGTGKSLTHISPVSMLTATVGHRKQDKNKAP